MPAESAIYFADVFLLYFLLYFYIFNDQLMNHTFQEILDGSTPNYQVWKCCVRV